MKYRPIHKNLDTSFVSLSALVKYLRRRQFLGGINVKLNGYRAEIHFGKDGKLRVSEHDEISGRTAHGEKAFQRLLIRSREAGGSINVFQRISERKPPTRKTTIRPKVEKKPEPLVPAHLRPVISKRPKPTARVVKKNGKPASDKPQPPVAAAPAKIAQSAHAQHNSGRQAAPKPVAATQPSLPNFPFKLTNKFEAKAQKAMSSPQDWQTFLKLVVELLTVVDRSIAAANLDFNKEFRKICAEIAGDYPLMNPGAGVFSYSKGRISMKKQMNAKMFIGGIAEALRRILLKLSRSRKYSEIYYLTSQRLQILIGKRASRYEKFGVSKEVKRIVSP